MLLEKHPKEEPRSPKTMLKKVKSFSHALLRNVSVRFLAAVPRFSAAATLSPASELKTQRILGTHSAAHHAGLRGRVAKNDAKENPSSNSQTPLKKFFLRLEQTFHVVFQIPPTGVFVTCASMGIICHRSLETSRSNKVEKRLQLLAPLSSCDSLAVHFWDSRGFLEDHVVCMTFLACLC